MGPDRKASMWWMHELAAAEDPISLEPLRKLRYSPFQCKADPLLSHGTDSDWFDGRVLAHYLVSTANFVHPISRRDLTRAECVALDEYCVEYNLGGEHVTRIFDAACDGDASVAQLRAEAETVLQSLFGRDAERRSQAAARANVMASSSEDRGLVVVDDDVRPSHAPTVDVSDGAASSAEAFPALAGTETVSAMPSVAAANWAAATSSGQVMVPPPPPPPPPALPTAEERARQSRARLEFERQAWAVAAAAAEARAAAEEAAMAAAAAADARAEAEQAQEWDAAVARSEVQRQREARAADAVASATAVAADAAARALHEASAGGDATLVWRLLEQGAEPTLPHAAFGGRVAYEVATNGGVRDAFRRYRREHATAFDWVAACVPSALSEVEEAAAEAAAKAAAKERKKAHERARKERRRTDAELLDATLEALRAANGADDEAALDAALQEAEACGVDASELVPFAEALRALRDPAARLQREREQRTEAARQRLGHLTAAQTRLVRGDSSDLKVSGSDDGNGSEVPCSVGDDASPSLAVTLVYQGRSEAASIRGSDDASLLFAAASRLFDLPTDAYTLKMIHKGKALLPSTRASEVLGASGAKLMVMASAREALARVQSTASDPAVASFAAEHGSRKAGVPVVRGRAARR